MALTNQQKTNISKIFKKINSALVDAIKPRELEPVARFAIDIIVKRTRLGYGVSAQFGAKSPLKKLSTRYVERRRRFGLDNLTAPKKSNLTLTGQMLQSMDIIKAQPGTVVIGPTGNRTPIGNEKKVTTNAAVAFYQEKQGRVFNRVSLLEYQQILRFYRRTFGDLLNKKHLLR